MKRRSFIKYSSALTLPMLLQSCNWLVEDHPYKVHVNSDAAAGHLIRKSTNFPVQKGKPLDYLVVGGGVAGMTAAYLLKGENFLLAELSQQLGGSSSFDSFEGLNFSQGAHYDLAYPGYYGTEVLETLHSLGIIHQQKWRDQWSFSDERHLILHKSKNQCFDHGSIRKDVLKEGPLKTKFLKLMAQFDRKMPLPSALVPSELKYLDAVTFYDFLKEHLPLDEDFMNGLDYHMKDDYGAGIKTVSALAGIHYFKCRPYYNEVVPLFSPPEGNFYFIDKMLQNTDQNRIKTGHLVQSIESQANGFLVKIVDIQNQVQRQHQVQKIIYAGQKHALPFIYPEEKELFASNQYAPWMVVNLATDFRNDKKAFWQNEMLTNDQSFMGFVDSKSQHSSNNSRVFTGYYCLPQSSRNHLLNTEKNKAAIAHKTIAHLSEYFSIDLTPFVKNVSIKAMGHAMPIPVPGYLFDYKKSKNKNLAFAGVDNGRLPLFLEAVDSAIQAVNQLKNN